jgi:hypothetical protein
MSSLFQMKEMTKTATIAASRAAKEFLRNIFLV